MTPNLKTVQYTYRANWISLVRPLTLTGSISPALAGGVLAARKGEFNPETLIIFLAAALLVQMAVNILNDYFDFLNGQDGDKWRETTGADSYAHPHLSQLPKVAAGMLTMAAGLGIWLALHSTIWILAIGGLSILAGIYYSAGKRSLSSIGAGELMAAVFLGFIVIGLSFIVETGHLEGEVLAIAIPYASLIASMILVNNIRDIEKDKGFRCTLPISFGRRKAMVLLDVLIGLPYFWVLLLIWYGLLTPVVSIVFVALPIALILRWKLRVNGTRAEEKGAMKWVAYHHWIFGIVFVLGIWLS